MEERDLVSQIEDFGLSNKEAKVYLACLELGASSVQAIADRAGIKRVTTYVILESLDGLGLVVRSIKAKKTYFAAENPTHLDRLLKRRADELAEQVISLKGIIPRLSALRSVPNEAPEVELYEGIESVSQLFIDFFTTEIDKHSEILQLSNLDDLGMILSERALFRARMERTKRHRGGRLLYTSVNGPVSSGAEQGGARESRFVPREQYPINGEVVIVGQSILMISLTKNRPIGVVLRHSDITTTLGSLFEMAWSFAATTSEK